MENLQASLTEKKKQMCCENYTGGQNEISGLGINEDSYCQHSV